jgi:hypothetical protein
MVDIGQNKDWSISDFTESRNTTIDGKNMLIISPKNTTMKAMIKPLKYLLKKTQPVIHSMPCRTNNKQLC